MDKDIKRLLKKVLNLKKMSNPSYTKHIQNWLESGNRDIRFELGILNAYCRKSFRGYPITQGTLSTLNAIDIASIEVDPDFRGQGVFTEFIEAFEQVAHTEGYAVYVESILEKRLNKFLNRRGYEDYNKFFPGTNSWIKF